MAAAAAAIRAAAALGCLSAAARHVASGLCHFAPRSARRGFVGDTAPTAAFTRPLLPHAPLSGPHVLLRRGLAVTPGEDDHSLGAEVSPDIFDPDSFDPEAPDDPETTFAFDEKDLESEEAMWALYERWSVFCGVKRDREDMLARFALFKDKARSIHEFNKSGKSWYLGFTRFDDWTPEEISRMFPPRLWRPLADRCGCDACVHQASSDPASSASVK